MNKNNSLEKSSFSELKSEISKRELAAGYLDIDTDKVTEEQVNYVFEKIRA